MSLSQNFSCWFCIFLYSCKHHFISVCLNAELRNRGLSHWRICRQTPEGREGPTAGFNQQGEEWAVKLLESSRLTHTQNYQWSNCLWWEQTPTAWHLWYRERWNKDSVWEASWDYAMPTGELWGDCSIGDGVGVQGQATSHTMLKMLLFCRLFREQHHQAAACKGNISSTHCGSQLGVLWSSGLSDRSG